MPFPIAPFFCVLTHIFLHDAEAWTESEEAAYAAVAKSREETTAAGGTARTETDVWTRHEYLIATQARIPVIKEVALYFKLGILKIAELLWLPTELKIGLQRMNLLLALPSRPSSQRFWSKKHLTREKLRTLPLSRLGLF